MKKSLLTLTVCSFLMCGSAFSQTETNSTHDLHHADEAPGRTCGTVVPSPEWDAWFNAKVDEYVQQYVMASGKLSSSVSLTVPVIVHVIHNNEAVGTTSNLSSTQINSQITILNDDYAGIGLNSSQCPTAFQSVKSNTGIHWCMALKDPNGNTLAEPGIQRIPYNSISGLAAPGGGYSQGTVDGIIKVNTIWNPVKYCNIWVCKLSGGILGYATFPAGSGLSGLFGTGNNQEDGVVIDYRYFGNSGTANAPYNKGRTAVHELGHWLGLRHINGDTNCGNDYCADTPTQDQLHGGCIPSSPAYHVNMCGSGTSPNGEMTMNFMDYTDDNCMYMFTNNQNTRMQTAMANGTYRSQLNVNSLTNCNTVSNEWEVYEGFTDVTVFPNPASNILNVTTSLKKENTISIKVFNTVGQVVATKNISKTFGGTYTIDLNTISSGVYFVSVSCPEKTITKRLVIDK